MLNGNKTLRIFDSFKIDKNLPKWKEKAENFEIDSSLTFVSESDNWSTTPSINSDDLITEFRKSSIDYLQYLKNQLDVQGGNLSIFSKFKFYTFIYFTSLFLKDKKKNIIIETKYSIEDFFLTIKNSKMELNKTKDILKKYEDVLIEARKNGQQSLVEKLIKMKDVISSECRLIENGITKYVTEDQVVKFYKGTDKNKKLKLTYVENYIRVIPSDVIELKDATDELKVFDNYVILHYDPLNNSTDLTEVEKEKAKDPIMFGVIQNSRKLYFIGDWIDEYCDLTFDKMMETIGAKEKKLTNRTVKSYINSI